MTELDPDADPNPDPNADQNPDPNADPTPPRPPRPTGPVQYKGADLEAERGPGLGCFRFQLAVLALFVVLTPLSVAWHWPEGVSAVLLFVLRLVAADRRSRRRPLGSATKTVGELEDDAADTDAADTDAAPLER